MFSKFDLNDLAKVGRIAGLVLFATAFLLPGVCVGANCYPGWFCAWETLCWTATFGAMLLHHERSVEWSFYVMVSGWITPLVLLGLIARNERVKRAVAKILPFLLLAPWFVFALPDGADPIRPSFGHYIWTASCLLIFTPQYVAIFARMRMVKNVGTERN